MKNKITEEMEPCWCCGHKMFVGKHEHCTGKYIVRCGSDGADCVWFPSSGAIEKNEISKYITAFNDRSDKWDIKEWPYQTHLRAKTEKEHLEQIRCLFGGKL